MLSKASASLSAAILIAAAMGATPALAQKKGGILKGYLPDNPPSASLHEESTVSAALPFAAIYNNLVMFDAKQRRDALDTIVPELAESWALNDDKTKLTFKLRDGVKWHDGKPFTAADVKCTFDGIMGIGEAKVRKNPRKPWYTNLKEVSVNSDREVTFTLGRPQPSFLVMLAGSFSPIYPCHVNAQQMRTKPVGTGPFKFVEFKQNEYIKLTRNPDYWRKGLPYLDGIEWTIVPSRSTAILGFISGQFDITPASQITAAVLKDVKAQDPKAVCDIYATNTHANLMLNRDKPPFDNADVRRAMTLALDRRAFITSIYDGEAVLGGAVLPPPAGTWGMPEKVLQTVSGFSPDIEKSREEGRKLMSALGYSAEKPLKIKVSTRNLATYRDPAVLMIDHLKNVFIEGELEVLDTSVWYARMARKDYQVGLNVTGVAIDDPDVNFYENYSCGSERNYTQYCNRDIEKLFDQQSQMSDVEKRRELVWQIDKQLQEDGARPIIAHGKNAGCWKPYVHNIFTAQNGIYNHWRFDEVWMDK